MKVCEYCDATLGDDVLVCPHCSSTKFKNKCPRCGREIDGMVCPACSEADRAAAEAERARAEAERAQERARVEADRARAEAEQKANQGLAWKTVLTVFVPFVGGYFLIDDNVKSGFRVFAIVWCAITGVSVGSLSGYDMATRVVTSLVCFAPIAYYLFKNRGKYLVAGQPAKSAPLIGFAVLLLLTLAVDAAGTARDNANPESGRSSTAAITAKAMNASQTSAESPSAEGATSQ